MNKPLSLAAVILSIVCAVHLSAQNPHTILFYNVENLFDPTDDPATDDDDFTPKGKYKWTDDKYKTKLGNLEQVILDVTSVSRNFPTVIGLAEVESRSVVEELASTSKLFPISYNIVHYDSPDQRGIDVAFMYRADKFNMEGNRAVRTIVPEHADYRTRDILTMWGTLEGEPFFFMVAHWPSRRSGKESSEYLRVASGTQMRHIADSVRAIRPMTKFVLMGDFNDDPNDKSVIESLGAKGRMRHVGDGDFYNPFYKMLMAGHGTLAYNGEWNLFDNIVVSENLVNSAEGRLTLLESIYNNTKFDGNIFKPAYLIQADGRYRGYPFRSFSGNDFVGGYSDHLPVFITID